RQLLESDSHHNTFLLSSCLQSDCRSETQPGENAEESCEVSPNSLCFCQEDLIDRRKRQ
ncbi:Dihydroorotase, partial [Clarias magur]